MPSKVLIDRSGKWSGGGEAVLSNLAYASRRYPGMFSTRTGVPLVARNYVPLGFMARAYILMPQNVWPWSGPWGTSREAIRKLQLRVASEVALSRAKRVVRISSLMPRNSRGGVLPNVLDEGFEAALAERPPPLPESPGSFLVPGSIGTYRNLDRVLLAYKEYRKAGFSRPLYIVGRVTDAKLYARLQFLGRGIDGVSYCPNHVPRSRLLSSLAMAHAAVFPSLVEASPVGLLEALVLCPRVYASDIVGHREVAGTCFPSDGYLRGNDVASIAAALVDSEGRRNNDDRPLKDANMRDLRRAQWADRLVMVLRL